MRSDILGFNAPIIQSGGYYTYGDRDYSIFNVSIKESGLLARVLDFILEIRTEISHPEMDKIIESITEAISDTRPLRKSAPARDEPLGKSMKLPEEDVFEIFEQANLFTSHELTWAGILKLIS